ncbi:tripartite tricarboxylate transporter TctB family protein [Pulveribacter sp.]|uniref:tripartite tricarboxylate transporter TctB family protein n=1 Tax=Pulveribacter sp. TaxID=2678893 RepID=UPI000EDF7787|nr:tripartite tricarboxylate transporter TctB family protein [Pulveribacter sp.]HCL87571.1 hypothetical protein [Comamonadaceae bacterium]
MTLHSQKRDRALAVILVLLSAALLAQSFQYPAESSQFPRFLMGVQLLFSLVFLVQHWRLPLEAAPQGQPGVLASLVPALKVFLVTSLYILAIDYLGYFVATAAFLLGSMALFGNRRLPVMALVTACFLALTYALFVAFMGVRLPQGLLF